MPEVVYGVICQKIVKSDTYVYPIEICGSIIPLEKTSYIVLWVTSLPNPASFSAAAILSNYRMQSHMNSDQCVTFFVGRETAQIVLPINKSQLLLMRTSLGGFISLRH